MDRTQPFLAVDVVDHDRDELERLADFFHQIGVRFGYVADERERRLLLYVQQYVVHRSYPTKGPVVHGRARALAGRIFDGPFELHRVADACPLGGREKEDVFPIATPSLCRPRTSDERTVMLSPPFAQVHRVAVVRAVP